MTRYSFLGIVSDATGRSRSRHLYGKLLELETKALWQSMLVKSTNTVSDGIKINNVLKTYLRCIQSLLVL